MRLALLFFLVVSVSAAAQNPVPDTTDWHRYIPLEIGNEWHYSVDTRLHPSLPIFERILHSYEVGGDSLVGGWLYSTLIHCFQEEGEDAVCDSDLTFVRADELSASVVAGVIVDGNVAEGFWLLYPCGLNAPFSNDPQILDCADGMPPPELESYVSGGPVEEHHVAGGAGMTGQLTFKDYSTLVSASHVLSDAGLLQWWSGEPDCGWCGYLRYARLDGVEYGDPVVIVANESGPELPERHNQLNVFPNPARSTATLMYVLDTSGRVILDVFDLQGRKIETILIGERPRGVHRLELATGHWADGLYQVRITSDQGFSATKGIIVVR